MYDFQFVEVAKAFLLKYNISNSYCFTTIASATQLDEDRFEIIRRMENMLSSVPVYEKIIFDRHQRCVEGFTYENQSDPAYTERYIYKQEEDKTIYDMFLYKNPGLKKLIRFKCHGWGVQTMEGIIKTQIELEKKLQEGTHKIIEKKD